MSLALYRNWYRVILIISPKQNLGTELKGNSFSFDFNVLASPFLELRSSQNLRWKLVIIVASGRIQV